MHENVIAMLRKYKCISGKDYKNALKEIIQEIALFGLWRSKFFEHAAFYGGTALRILYGLDRFSEDLDFSLLQPQKDFQLSRYENSLQNEIESFGFSIVVDTKVKNRDTTVQSAFIKANTRMHMLKINAPEPIRNLCQTEEQIKIKFEIETDPAGVFQTESQALTQPLPFTVRTYTLPYLFAGKLHALLFRKWGKRVKGRDWYDSIWFIGRKIPVHLGFLEQKMRQSGDWEKAEPLSKQNLVQLIKERVHHLDLDLAKHDVIRFVHDPRSIEIWSADFFLQVAEQISTVEENRQFKR